MDQQLQRYGFGTGGVEAPTGIDIIGQRNVHYYTYTQNRRQQKEQEQQDLREGVQEGLLGLEVDYAKRKPGAAVPLDEVVDEADV